MTVCTIVGARPQFIKASVVSRTLQRGGVRELIVQTGQHYDDAMSRIFFDDLGIPLPDVNLQVGSGSHGYQTGEIMVRLEAFLESNRDVDGLLVYGDTNSTLAGALTAAKMHVPVAHVEAGLRSFNKEMPEEINRIVSDRLSSLLFCPTQTAIDHLADEGITHGVVLTGDVMLEATRFFAERANEHAPLSKVTRHAPLGYYLATIHRAENTDDPTRLEGILEGLARLDLPVVLPMHPRTRNVVDTERLPAHIEVTAPVGYLEMLTLVSHARGVLTDSGGLQKEAYWLSVPCVTLRDETEWVETLEGGWNRVVGADPDAIEQSVQTEPRGDRSPFGEAPQGSPSDVILSHLREALPHRG